MSAKDGLPCDAVHWAIEDDADAFWLYTACGLARVALADLDAWVADVKKSGTATRRVEATVLDHADGLRIHAMPEIALSIPGAIAYPPLSRSEVRAVRLGSRSAGRPRSAKPQNGRA